MGELGLLEMLQPYLATASSVGGLAGSLTLGAGDDAALWRPGSGSSVAVTTDSQVEDVHFRRPPDDAAAADIGWKLLAVSLSDLAAMGAAPGPAFISLSLPPDWQAGWVAAMYRGMFDAATPHGGCLAGGNISASATAVLTSTCLGQVDPEQAMTRDGAQPGWVLAVTGTIGGAAAALRLEPGEASEVDAAGESWRRRLVRPEPRLRAGRIASERGITVAIDVSDGLFADSGRLLRPGGASGVVIDGLAIPIAAGIREAWPEAWLEVAGGGEDYELLLAGPQARVDAALAAIDAAGTPGRTIGAFDLGEGVRVSVDGRERPAPEVGHQHFG